MLDEERVPLLIAERLVVTTDQHPYSSGATPGPVARLNTARGGARACLPAYPAHARGVPSRHARRRVAVVMGLVIGVLMLIATLGVAGPAIAPAPAPISAACAGAIGPGIAPPARVSSGIAGFHASWYGQSGYPTLCPGERSNAVVAFYTSGPRG